jgi:ATP-dependent DNA helicase RecG
MGMTNYQLNRASLRGIDGQPISDTSISLIDLARVEAHIALAITRGRYQGSNNVHDYLREKHCIAVSGESVQATPAGILCFGRQPQEVFPRAVVDLAHYRGIEAVSFEVAHLEKNIGGTIFEQIERVEIYLWNNTHHGMTLDNTSAQRHELHEYPRPVIRELVVNMVAHRDYATAMSTSQIMLFRDRIEWLNPGGLPTGITINDIRAVQAARNPIILSILYEAGYVEAIGQGIDTVITVLARENMEPPRFEDTASFFQVTVFGKPPERFYDSDVFTRLSDRQRRILAFIRAQREVSPAAVAEIFENIVTARSLQRDIKTLEDANLITTSGTGRGRSVRYRIKGEPL